MELRVVVARREFESIARSFHNHTQVAYHGRWPMTMDEARTHMEKWRKALEWQLSQWEGETLEVDYDALLAEPVNGLLDLFDWCYEGLDLEELGRKRVIAPALDWLDEEMRHYAGDRSDAGQDDGHERGEPGLGSSWTRKRPCCPGGG